eukprot:s1664_g7.t1
MNPQNKDTAQYQTLKRIQKKFLVRCNESLTKIIPGSGVRPASEIRRQEKDLKAKRQELGKLAEQELLLAHMSESGARTVDGQVILGCQQKSPTGGSDQGTGEAAQRSGAEVRKPRCRSNGPWIEVLVCAYSGRRHTATKRIRA